MKKILVTGALGQIGRFLVRELIHQDFDSVGLDVRNSTELTNFDLLNFEISDREQLEKKSEVLKNINVLIHLASKIDINPDILSSGNSSVDLNIKGTLNLLEFLPNLEHVCFTSTYMVYGISKSNPVTENHATNPSNVYGASKLSTEKFLQVYSIQKKIPVTILRLMGVYNLEKPYNQAIPTFIKKISIDESPILYGDGSIRRNHLYIDDAIEAIMKTIKNPVEGVFNIGGPDSPSNLELVEIINKKLGKSVKPVFQNRSAKVYDFIIDISKAKNDLQFVPKVGIEEGLEKTIERFNNQGW